jgi:prephenate dehydrogenase
VLFGRRKKQPIEINPAEEARMVLSKVPDDDPLANHRFRCVAISGVGLLGGSLGLALCQMDLADQVVGIGRSAARLDQAVEAGALDSWSLDLEEVCAEADLIVLCGPVSVILDQIPKAIACAQPGAVITDIGSTKRSIVERATRCAREGVHFVGSHPMAGSEKSGAQYAEADLYKDATCIVTPALTTDESALNLVHYLWRSVGMDVVDILPNRHDRLVALISHLPHVAASVVSNLVQEMGGNQVDQLRRIAANGFRDTTRVAMGGVEMWTDILTDNSEAVIEVIDGALTQLYQLRGDLLSRNTDGIAAFLKSAADLRRQF